LPYHRSLATHILDPLSADIVEARSILVMLDLACVRATGELARTVGALPAPLAMSQVGCNIRATIGLNKEAIRAVVGTIA
jgi:hypothetical protein